MAEASWTRRRWQPGGNSWANNVMVCLLWMEENSFWQKKFLKFPFCFLRVRNGEKARSGRVRLSSEGTLHGEWHWQEPQGHQWDRWWKMILVVWMVPASATMGGYKLRKGLQTQLLPVETGSRSEPSCGVLCIRLALVSFKQSQVQLHHIY